MPIEPVTYKRGMIRNYLRENYRETTVTEDVVSNALDALHACADGDWEAEIRMFTGQVRQAGTIVRMLNLMPLLETEV
jgi:20S proteasome alpha/beta subunit